VGITAGSRELPVRKACEKRHPYRIIIIIIIIIHGRNPHDLSQQHVDIEALNKWLTSADLFAETESFLTAIQDQVILTRNYMKYILKQPNIDELCRRRGKEPETIQHITAACEQLAPTECVKR
jgi:hypothetical protein